MNRLADDIALLDRVNAICSTVIDPDPQLVVPRATLDAIAEQIDQAVGRPVDYRLIGDEARCPIIAVRNLSWARADGDRARVDRWTGIAERLRAAIALDLHNARQSLGEVE